MSVQARRTAEATSIDPDMIVIPAGPVTLGVPDYPMGCTLPHRWMKRSVDVPAFAIARYAVTVAEYRAFANATGYAIAPELETDRRFQHPRAPAAFVSWIDAVRYTQWLARETGKPYRLVRDAEYEKAARGMLEGRKYPWGDESPEGRCDFNNPDDEPRAVGSFAPNGYGLFDMAGSMWSWCEECFDQVAAPDEARMCYDDTLIRDVRLNPVCRGGSFKSADATNLWCAHRHEDPTDGRYDCIGLRVALSVAGA